LLNILISCWICVICVMLTCAAERSIPNFIHVCRKNDPLLDDCMVKSIETLRPYLVKGIPELDVPSIDPMIIGDLLMSERTRTNGLRLSAKKIRAFGASLFKLKKIEVVEYGRLYNVEAFFPKLNIDGVYEINGQMLQIPVKGSGPLSANYTDCTGNIRLMFERKQENDLVHLKKLIIKIKVGGGRVRLDNLFNGDRILGDAVNNAINQNFDSASRDIIPIVERALQRVIKDIATKITKNFTYKQVFPL